MKRAQLLIDKVFWVTDAISRILVCMIFGIMWVVVFGRYFFSYTPMWSEDLILFSMCWLVMLSGAEAFRRDAHLRITIFQNMLPEKLRFRINVCLDLLTILFFAWLMRYGIEQVMSNVTVMYTGLKVSKMWVFLSFPVSFILSILAKADKYIIRCNKKSEEQEEIAR